MKIIRNILPSNNLPSACVATIGNFDGLHLGHQKIIDKLKLKAEELELPLTIISFEPLPSEFFMPAPPARIYPMRDKVRLMHNMEVDNYLCLTFNNAFASMSPEDFIQEILLDRLNVKYLGIGDDFRFGHKRAGDSKLLKKVGEAAGMTVVDTATCFQDGERISSTRIRVHLENGDISTANKLLGHSYQLSGRIRHGEKKGRTIGFPTINMKILEHIAPQRGVYAVKVHGLATNPIKGVANLGNRPTVGGTENRLETHMFNFDRDVYGEYACIELVEFIRPEKCFESFDLLKAQILNDAETAKNILQ